MKKVWKKTCLLAISCLALGAASLLGACGKNEKQVYYETQVRFYVNPEKSTITEGDNGLNTSGSEYGVYGAYEEQVMQDIVDCLNGDFLIMVWHSLTAGQSENVGEIYEQITEGLEYSFVSSKDDPLARSFIYANISVPEDVGKEFADDLYETVINMTPEYVEENMAIPAGYTGTNCQRISRDDALRRIEK